MPKKYFFWKLFFSYVVIVVSMAMVIGVLVNIKLKQSLLMDVENNLKSRADDMVFYGRRVFREGRFDTVQSDVRELGDRTKTRVTFILPDGTVIADSDEDPGLMENHLDRAEVKAVREKEFGIVRRFSETVNDSLLYVAKAVEIDGAHVGTVRVSIPLSDIQSRLSSMRLTIVFGATIGIIVALLVGGIVARKITKPVREMTEVAQALRKGNYEERVNVTTTDEIGVLGDVFNQLGKEITKKIDSLSREESQLRAMMASMVEGVIAVGPDDRMLFCNEAAREMLGLSLEEGREKKIWDFTPLVVFRELVVGARKQKRAIKKKIEIVRSDKDLLLDVVATSFVSGSNIGVIVVLHDISELRKLEMVRRDFVANVSHELKTPLTSIKGYVQTLLDGAVDDKEHNLKFLERIDSNADQLANLVQDLLSLARIESEEAILEVEDIDWNHVVVEATSHFEEVARNKGLELDLEITDSPVVVRGDRKSMRQIANNLIDNAIKYTAKGKVVIRSKKVEARGLLEIEDTGMGMAEQELTRIFERFYRVDHARSRDLGGTGLGLAIVKHLAFAMDGEVKVTSSPDVGSHFSVSLPMIES